MHRGALATWLLAAVCMLDGGSAQAAELLMFEEPGCAWCRRWHAEIGPSYPLTDEGRLAPLRRVRTRDQARGGVSLQGPVTATPTFVLAEGGREIGRIVGYPGGEFFYGLLARLLERLPSSRYEGQVLRDSACSPVCRGLGDVLYADMQSARMDDLSAVQARVQ